MKERINGTDLNANLIEDFAKKAEKRSGGGSVQIGMMAFKEIAEVIVKNSTGFDKKNSTSYESREYVLSRIFEERGWPKFDKAIVLAGARRTVDINDGFIPLAVGNIDIEAAIEFNSEHRELKISTIQRESNPIPVNDMIGFSTEYGNNGDSFETIIPIATPGIWTEIKDIQFDRPTGMVIVTPYLTLWCEGMSINNLFEFPTYLGSVKMLEAIKIAKRLV